MLNLNIGILGHVDSGKTTLARTLSQIASTAAFDKNPQSQARGITIDLGFSSLCIATPEHLVAQLKSQDQIQLTLVDCPGHASLIRTIIGGAQIIDLILLVVDVTKGIQTQTAECLVIGEIMCRNMIVVLNKVDLLEEEKKSLQIGKMEKRIKHILASTCFAQSPIVSISAMDTEKEDRGINNLLHQISKSAFIPARNTVDGFLFAVDHCFGIKGKGTILTGTVLQGYIGIDDVIDLPILNTTKKIKSMQMFKTPVVSASAGDRVGICVTQFDPKLMERGIACSPGVVNWIHCAVLPVNRIKYFKGHVSSKSKFHITIGHETAIASIICFINQRKQYDEINNFDLDQEYEYIEALSEETLSDTREYLLLEFEKPVLAVNNCTIIGSKFDMDIHKNDCRIAFWGKLLFSCKGKDYKTSFLPKLKIFKNKLKTGVIERVINENVAIVKGMFKKETNIDVFIGLKVILSPGESTGIIEGSFGQSGKVKLFIPDCLDQSIINCLNTKNKSKTIDNDKFAPITVTLSFKRYIFDNNKKIVGT